MEARTPPPSLVGPDALRLLLRVMPHVLKGQGGEADENAGQMAEALRQAGKSQSGPLWLPEELERGGARLIDYVTKHFRDPFTPEQFRGSVPDRVLAAIYGCRCNEDQPADVLLRIRQLAERVDQSGRPLPGFKFRPTGELVLTTDYSNDIAA